MSTATAGFPENSLAMPAWKSVLSHIGAAVTALLFLAAGIAKIVMPFQFQQLFEQLLIPAQVSLPLVLVLGVVETFAGILVLGPKHRRWGGLLASLLLVAFMIYVGVRYDSLVGRDCSCFPWVKRAVGPAFFWEDAGMLVASLVATFFSRKAFSLKIPAMVLGGLIVFSGASFAYNTMQQSGIQVPETITVDGKPYSLREGRVFLFFFDPQCSHCEEAARNMATYKWKSDIALISLPTNMPEWAAGFLHDTKFNAKVSNDTAELRKLFVFPYPPYGVFVDHGRVKGVISHFDPPDQPKGELSGLGMLE
ncbi:MAG: MauE/DoxX family redox-associated membrane protein [Bryobacteraceae bacterium]